MTAEATDRHAEPDEPGSSAGPAEDPVDTGWPVPEGCDFSVFAALADPTRRQMLEVLVESGRASATTLAERLPVSRQAVMKHLHVLEAAGLVGGARAGREVLYVARAAALEASARWLTDLSAAWRLRHEAIAADVGACSNQPT